MVNDRNKYNNVFKIAIMQPYLFPHIGYWQLIDAVDTFIIYDDVNFISRGYINRNYILVNNQPQRFTLELIKASQNKLINEINIGNNRHKILKTLEMAYKKAYNFYAIFPIIYDILNKKERNLAKLIAFSIRKLSAYLDLDTSFICSSNIEKNISLKGQDKIINICKKFNAKVYINPAGGTTLYDKRKFAKENIRLEFLQPKTVQYKQFNNKFVPNLSIVDVLMFNTKEDVKKILKRYETV